MELETIVGPLSETIHKVDLATVQTASQITTQRRDNPALRKQSFLAGDSALYRIEDNKVVLYLGKADTNLIFRNPSEAIRHFPDTGSYNPSKGDIEAVIGTPTVTRFVLSTLGFYLLGDEDRIIFGIDTSLYNTPTPTRKVFAEQVYGAGEDFAKNMKMLYENGIRTAKVKLLSPTYVREQLNKSGNDALVRTCNLNEFDSFSNFNATGINEDSLRAVPKPIAKGDK